MERQELEKYILETYGSVAAYHWITAPRYAVYRHSENRNWFAGGIGHIKTKARTLSAEEIVNKGALITMKKMIQIACCALGSGMIGYFANQLNTVAGSVLFTLGVVMLVISIVLMTKQDKENQ